MPASMHRCHLSANQLGKKSRQRDGSSLAGAHLRPESELVQELLLSSFGGPSLKESIFSCHWSFTKKMPHFVNVSLNKVWAASK